MSKDIIKDIQDVKNTLQGLFSKGNLFNTINNLNIIAAGQLTGMDITILASQCNKLLAEMPKLSAEQSKLMKSNHSTYFSHHTQQTSPKDSAPKTQLSTAKKPKKPPQ